MQSARHLVAAAAEFTACMQHRKDDRNSRDAKFWLDTNRDSAPIVAYLYDIPRQQIDFNLCAVSSQCFVNRVIDDFIHQMMQAARSG